MIEDTIITIPTVYSSRVSPHTSSSDVPRDVINKYEVEKNTNNLTPEEILKTKINEAVVDNEAFYIVDLGAVVRKHQEWTANLPRVKPYYAIKCNPDTAIIKLLGSLGTNFDCASKAEIQQILGCGIAPSRIIYANPCKMKSHIEYARESQVEMMTFDNSHELTKIASIYPNAKLLLRIITDDSQSICRFSTKFGAPLDTTSQLLALSKELGLNVCGVSFHVGSGCMSSTSFVSAIRSAHRVFKEAEQLGLNFTTLDLGGGWPGINDERIDFPVIAGAIRPILDELFPENIDIIAEPGRFFVAQSHTLAVNVFAKRTVVESATNEKHFLYYVNDGVYQSFNCILFDHYTPTAEVLMPNENVNTQYKSTVFGPTCDSMDCIGKDILLPELEVGEWLYFKNMGAYSVAAASPFNGFKSHPTMFYYY
jgi:ornithine decarboxylase